MPRGFSLNIKILSTWGDIHYCGLNGIEIYNHNCEPIIQDKLCNFKIAAQPSSINTLKGQEKDVRTVDKLVNSINDTFDDRNMWLVPFLSKNNEYNDSQLGLVNQIFLVFEEPIIISAINIWNYTKTPTRGVREMQIFIDDLLIFQGFIRKAPTKQQFLNNQSPIASTILFTNQKEFI